MSAYGGRLKKLTDQKDLLAAIFDTTMGRVEAAFGPGCMRVRPCSDFQLKYPVEDRPLAARREPSALEGWILKILYCDPKGSRGFLEILSMEGRGVRLCWEKSKTKGPQGRG